MQQVTEEYNNYEPTRAARAIQAFVVDDVSNWYVRLNRKRFWRGDYNDDKRSAYQTLYQCLATTAKLMAPIAPFYAERLYLDLNKVTGQDTVASVHMTEFPTVNEALLNSRLEQQMGLAQTVSSLTHSLRKKHTIKVRQPLSRMLIPVLDSNTRQHIEKVEDLILSEVNIKGIEYVDDASAVVVKKIKPNFRRLGQQYGKQMKLITAAIQQFDQEQIKTFETQKSFELQLDGQTVTLGLEDVEITSEDIPGWSVANEGGLTVALDINITEELRQEGIARDLVNRIQNLRKDMGLDVQDKIKISVADTDALVNAALQANKAYVCGETQATALEITPALTGGVQMDLDEHSVQVKIET